MIIVAVMDELEIKLANEFINLLIDYELGNQTNYDDLMLNLYAVCLDDLPNRYTEFIHTQTL